MSDTKVDTATDAGTTDDKATTDATSTAATSTAATATDPAAEVDKWKALARKHEARAKENAAKAKNFDELTEAQKTELQKATDRADAAEKRAADTEALVLRLDVGREKGLTPGQVKRLVGATREELEADADEMLQDVAPSTKDKPDFGGGDRGTDVGAKGAQLTLAQIKTMTPAEIVKAKAEGRCDALLGRKTA